MAIAVDADVPVNGPVVIIILFFGESGSTWDHFSTKYFVAKPLQGIFVLDSILKVRWSTFLLRGQHVVHF